MSVDAGQIGYERDSEEFRVNTARLAQFAAALDDTNEAHRAGRVAPPLFHHVPVMQSLVEVLGAATRAFVLHGEHDIHFNRPVVPGQRLASRSRLVGVRPTKAGAAVVVQSEIDTYDRARVSTQFSTCLITSAKTVQEAGDAAPAPPETVREGDGKLVSHALGPDQAGRYAEAARDYSPYTLDKAAAALAGFPAPILHGMCTLAFASRVVVDEVCAGDSRRLLRIGGRFSSPVFMVPDQNLTTRFWVGPNRDGRRAVAFETTELDGKLAIKNGFAEVGP